MVVDIAEQALFKLLSFFCAFDHPITLALLTMRLEGDENKGVLMQVMISIS
jgi:hypothetical protein